MKDLFDEKGLYELEMSPEQTDFLWFLDQCGFDVKVRALRHTDVFDRVRGLLMHKNEQENLALESSLHHNFLLEGYSRNPSPGHPAARRHYNRFWGYKFPSNQKSNLIHVKLRQIEAGFTPVLPHEKLTLPKGVQDTGSKRALMLMLALPDRITDRYHEWAQNLCFIDQLLELKPDYSLLHELRDEYHAEFLKLYKSELSYAKQPEYGRRKDGEALAFYKKLFKFQYPVKRDIIHCLCEAKLNA